MRVVVLDLEQFSDRGCALCLLFYDLDVGSQPQLEVSRFSCIAKDEQGRSLHRFSRDGGFHTTRLTDHLHTAVVARQHGALNGGHGNKKLPLGVFTVDEKWSRDSDRDLGNSPDVLDVSGHDVRIIRELLGVV